MRFSIRVRVRVRLEFSIRLRVRVRLGFSIRVRVRRLKFIKFDPNPTLLNRNPNNKLQPNPNPYPNNKPQPSLNSNFTNWEVAKEVNVLLNAKTYFVLVLQKN